METSHQAILWPTFAMAALIFGVWFTLLFRRLRHIATNPPGRADFANKTNVTRYFQPVERPADNLANLFEMPTLYFAVVLIMLFTHQGSGIQTALAWGFVQFRAIHSFVHIGPNAVRTRFRLYLISCVILSAMWIGLAVDLALHPAGTT